MWAHVRFLLLGLVAVGCSWILAVTTPPSPRAVPGLAQGIRAWLWVPDGEGSPFPLVVILAGAQVSGHLVDDPAADLVRSGFAVASLDLYDCPQSAQALRGVLATLRPNSRIDARRMAMVAHSWSVGPATEVARHQVQALVALGYDPTQRRGSRPVPNLLLVFGAYDDSISQQDMLAALAGASQGLAVPRVPGRETGRFADGTARMLLVSPLSNHGGEPFDPMVSEATRQWLEKALELPSPHRQPTISSSWRHLATLVLLCVLAAWMRPWLNAQESWQRPRSRACRLAAWVGPWLDSPGFPQGPRSRDRALVVVFLPLSALVVLGWAPALEGVCAMLVVTGLVASCDASQPLGRLLAWHLGALVVASEGLALLSHLGSGRAGSLLDWGTFLGLMQLRYAPSMAGGVMHAWQEQSAWPLLLVLFATWGLALLVSSRPSLVTQWLMRWTLTLRGRGGLVVVCTLGALVFSGVWATGAPVDRAVDLGVLGLVAGAVYVGIAGRHALPHVPSRP